MSGPYRVIDFKKPAATIRAQSEATAADAATASATTDEDGGLARYTKRAVRIIPAEVISAYTAALAILVPAGGPPDPTDMLGYYGVHWALPIAGFLVTVGLRVWGSRDASGSIASVQWGLVALSALTYVGWVLSLGHPLFGFETVDPRLGPLILTTFGIVMPAFYKGSEETA